jgi:hypothetical protein
MPLAESLSEKIGPLPTWGWLGLATGAAGAYYVIEKRKASSTGTTSAAAAEQQLAAEEAAAANVAATTTPNYGYGGGNGSAGSGHTHSWSPPASTTAPVGTTTPVGSTAPPTGTTAPPTGTTAPTGPTAPAPVKVAAGPISNLQASNVTSTGATIRWNADSGNTQGYAYNVTQLNGKSVKSGNTNATSVALTGLHSKYTYNFGVQGLPGGAGDNIHFTTT